MKAEPLHLHQVEQRLLAELAAGTTVIKHHNLILDMGCTPEIRLALHRVMRRYRTEGILSRSSHGVSLRGINKPLKPFYHVAG